MLLNDKVSFRMQWPQYTDLKVNGMFASLYLLTFFSFLLKLLFHVLVLTLVWTSNYYVIRSTYFVSKISKFLQGIYELWLN